MLKDTDGKLLCPVCGGELWVGTWEFFYGPAFYDAEAHDHIDHEIAIGNGPTESEYTGLWCQQCRWMTREVDKYLEEE